jgi:hypothetical protein
MADNIVGGLFGVDPAQLQQQRMAQDLKEGFMLAQLSPMERATAGIYAGSKQLGRASQSLLGMEDPQLQEAAMAKKLSENFDVNSVEGLRGLAIELQRAGSLRYSQLAAQQANQLEQAGLTRQKTAAQTEQAEAGKIIQVDLGDRIQLVNALTKEVIREIPKGLTPQQAAKQASGGAAGDGIGKLTPAQKAVDTKFSKEYTEFVSAGGSTTIAKNLQMLDDAIKIIETEPDGSTSGKLVGLSDKAGTISYSHPKAAEAKDLIGGVAQSNLRAVLGGQFAAREGEQLLARAYNTAQPKKDNLNRLKALRKQIQDAADAKINASQYYEENGTLKGFKGNYSVTPDLGEKDNNDPLGLRKK